MKDRIFENALNVIRNYLKEEGSLVTLPTNNATNIIDVERKGPPVKKKPLPGNLFRRTKSVQPEYPR
jgi:hypothetical protein